MVYSILRYYAGGAAAKQPIKVSSHQALDVFREVRMIVLR